MAQNKYLSSDRSALFSIENDVDDDEFLRKRPTGSGYPDSIGNIPSYSNDHFNNRPDNFEEKRLQMLEMKKEIEGRTVESTKRSLSLLRNSEQIGIATAEELLKQREQLERTDKRLDDINNTLKFSQKHIRGIKSLFGSFKNYLGGKADSTPSSPQYTKDSDQEISSHTRPVSQTVANSSTSGTYSSNSDHPGLRIRGLGSPEDDLPAATSNSNPQKIIDENIDEIVSSISRLKGLARNLGEEIESQNDLLDNILPKVETSDITIQRQNKDIKRLLN